LREDQQLKHYARHMSEKNNEELRRAMKLGKYSLSVLIAISIFCSFVAAQQGATSSSVTVPRLVNFSGKATDAQGKSVSGIAGATFAIYRDQYEGTPLWLETQNVQADTKGNYTVQLGATKPDGLSLDLFSSGEARWLGVTVNGGQEQPRVLLLSVPYALKAADAETIGGLPPSAFVLANKTQGNGGSAKPPSAPSSPAKNAAPPANPAVTGKGTLDFVPMWDSTSDIINSMIFQKSSAIGIGTTAPAATLDVNGRSDVRDTLTLFPKGTDSALAVNGTSFKVDQTGKVTFVSGQTFPGTGTVTNVGFSAPTPDFIVGGSPVTKSGTLALIWNVAPTSLNTANAIVKRDGTGSFNAGAITASLGVTGLSSGSAAVTGSNSSSGSGVFGTSASGIGVYGTSTSGPAIWGETSGSGGAADGVHGVAHGAGSGVTGVTDSTSGVGVWGQGPGLAMYANGNVGQGRTAGGWVKAMAFFSPYNGGRIALCFNSTLSGAPATTPPCGFTFHIFGAGDYMIDFGFQVDDRFLSATTTGYSVCINQAPCVGYTIGVCTDAIGVACGNTVTPNEVEITSWNPQNVPGYADAKFYLIVY
jgi:hypothetical protein